MFASLLLLGNLFYALAIGDFGASSQRYVEARDVLRDLDRSPHATTAGLETQQQRVEQLAADARTQRERFWPHVWLGIVASLVALLVNCISVTYFIGTNRWCREVVEAYRMPNDLALQSQQLKRHAFPWALIGILVTLAIASLGAAADPYSTSSNPAGWVIWHWAVALLGVAAMVVSFAMQVAAVGRNYEIIQQILAKAEQMRAEQRAKKEPIKPPT